MATIESLSDLSTFPPGGGMDLTFIRITGSRVVLEWVARSWLTPKGFMIWAKDRGRDIRKLENSDHSDDEVERWRQNLVDEAKRVPFVSDCALTITVDEEEVILDARLTLTDGLSYPLVVSITDASVAILATRGTA